MNLIWFNIRNNLSVQLVLLFTTLVLIAIGLVGLQILPAWRSEIEENVRDTQARYVEQESLEVEIFVSNLDEDIRFLGNLGSVEGLANLLIDPDAGAVDLSRQRDQVEEDFLAFTDARRVYNQVRFLDATGEEIVRIDFDGESASITPQARLASKGDRDYFILTAALPAGDVFVSRLDLNREGTPPAIEGTFADGTLVPTIRYGVPIYARNLDGEEVLAGVVVTNVLAINMLDLLNPNTDDANLFLMDRDGYYLKNSENPNLTFGFEPDIDTVGGVSNARAQDRFSDNIMSRFVGASLRLEDVTSSDELIYYKRISPPDANYYWTLAVTRDRAVAFEPVNEATNRVLLTTAIAVVVISIIGAIAIRLSLRPLNQLTAVAEQIAGGNREARSRYDNRPDEIGALSRSFNSMSTEMNTALQTLENRVTLATRDLQALIDVNLQTVSLLNSERLIQAVANLAKERFELYHAQFYMLEGDQLQLAAGAGYVGRQMLAQHHQIALNHPHSIVAKAAREEKTVLMADVETTTDFLPNLFLPDTKTELAIPLIVRNELLGVMDLQSSQRGVFDERFIAILEVLALQVSNAISNARLFETTARENRHELALSEITAAVQRASSVDDVLKTAARELGRALRVPHTVIEVQLRDQDS